MADVHYHILWPAGNTTAIVAEPVVRDRHVATAAAIMRAQPQIEQVGFLEPPRAAGAMVRLQMMGGEFCGNAARAAAHFWALGRGFGPVRLEVSGLPGVIHVETTPQTATVILPGDFFQRRQAIPEGCLVDLQGIRHVLVDDAARLDQAGAIIAKYGADYPALGVVYIQRNGGRIKNRPRVWVRATNTCVDETACGSGSIAAAIAAYDPIIDQRTFAVEQPSHEVCTVCLEPAERGFSRISLSGAVAMQGEGVVTVA